MRKSGRSVGEHEPSKTRRRGQAHEGTADADVGQSMQDLASCRLGWWAVRTTASGMALVRDKAISNCNARWHELSRLTGNSPIWTVLPNGEARRTGYHGLREVALHEASRLAEGPLPTWSMIRCRGDGREHVIELRAEKVAGGHGMVVLLAHEVTEQLRAEAELRAAQEALDRRHRLEAVGELASGLAHDLNNALNVMRMRLELFRREMPEACSNPHFEAFTRTVDDAAARVLRMHELSRKQSDPSMQEVDLRQVIDDAIDMARTELEQRSVGDVRQFRLLSNVAELPPVRANLVELKHLFVNLLLNARDAMPDGGTISVDASRDEEFAVVSVSDEGTGIPEDQLETIFESFFTTKGPRGTGLGLSMARSAMARLGGSIVARNRPQRGAEFLLRFPLCTGSAATRRPKLPPPVPSIQRSLRVLLVDDDPDSLEVTKQVLRIDPLEVDTANSGTEALKKLDADAYDLLLCDVGMPDMSGWQVAQKARVRHPEMRIFMVTGWANEFVSAESRPGSVDGVIAKPVEIDELRSLIARASLPAATPRPEAARS
jgi:signal transduction histidine kinase/ActR/RegA family two-component response regulator